MFRIRFITVFSLLCAGGLMGCQRPVNDHPSNESGPPPVRVTVTAPARKTLVRTVELPGRTEAYEVAPLFAKVTGYVTKIPVDIGTMIRGPHGDEPGTVLCELLVPELREELAQKAALVKKAQAEVQQADAGVKLAEASVRSAAARVLEAQAAIVKEDAQLARWQSEFDRVAQLAKSGVVTQKVADETRSQFDAATAGRKEVVAKIASVEALRQEMDAALVKAEADVAAVRSQLAVAEAEQRRVTAMLDYATIRAPFDGVVTARNVHTGHLVTAGGASNQQPMLVVMRVDPLRVIVDVPEVDAPHIRDGSPVELKFPSSAGDSATGTITRTSWSLNTTSRTLTAEIDVPNTDGRRRPGQYVQVKVTVAELNDVLSLPKTAIVTQDKQTYCFAVGTDNRVVRLPITLGLQAGNEFEIREGLSGDEKVIGVNPSAFREGQTVEVAPPADSPAK
jgi:HlyD family secretion protein